MTECWELTVGAVGYALGLFMRFVHAPEAHIQNVGGRLPSPCL